MTLPKQIVDRQYQQFEEDAVDGGVNVRVAVQNSSLDINLTNSELDVNVTNEVLDVHLDNLDSYGGSLPVSISKIDFGLPGTPEIVAFNTSTSTASTNSLAANTSYFIEATESCYICFASSPTAASTCMRLPADLIIEVTTNTAVKVAALGQLNSGTLKATPRS